MACFTQMYWNFTEFIEADGAVRHVKCVTGTLHVFSAKRILCAQKNHMEAFFAQYAPNAELKDALMELYTKPPHTDVNDLPINSVISAIIFFANGGENRDSKKIKADFCVTLHTMLMFTKHAEAITLLMQHVYQLSTCTTGEALIELALTCTDTFYDKFIVEKSEGAMNLMQCFFFLFSRAHYDIVSTAKIPWSTLCATYNPDFYSYSSAV